LTDSDCSRLEFKGHKCSWWVEGLGCLLNVGHEVMRKTMTHDIADTPLAPHTYSYCSLTICQIVQCQSQSNVNAMFHMRSQNHRCREDRRASCLKVKNSY